MHKSILTCEFDLFYLFSFTSEKFIQARNGHFLMYNLSFYRLNKTLNILFEFFFILFLHQNLLCPNFSVEWKTMVFGLWFLEGTSYTFDYFN